MHSLTIKITDKEMTVLDKVVAEGGARTRLEALQASVSEALAECLEEDPIEPGKRLQTAVVAPEVAPEEVAG